MGPKNMYRNDQDLKDGDAARSEQPWVWVEEGETPEFIISKSFHKMEMHIIIL